MTSVFVLKTDLDEIIYNELTIQIMTHTVTTWYFFVGALLQQLKRVGTRTYKQAIGKTGEYYRGCN